MESSWDEDTRSPSSKGGGCTGPAMVQSAYGSCLPICLGIRGSAVAMLEENAACRKAYAGVNSATHPQYL